MYIYIYIYIYTYIYILYIYIWKLFYDGVPYHMETCLLICSANQWTGFYMIGAYIMKELMAYIYGVKGKKV